MINCKICGREFKLISKRHLVHHDMTRLQYMETFPDAPMQSEESSVLRSKTMYETNKNMSAETKAIKAEKIAKSRAGMSSWNLGKGGYKLEWSDEARQRVANRVSHLKGKPLSEEVKRHLSKVMSENAKKPGYKSYMKGKRLPSETKQKISESLKGRKLTAEQQEKHAKAMERIRSTPGYTGPMKGKKHSIETKQQISKTLNHKRPEIRKTFEDRGYWVPLENISEFEIYKRNVRLVTERNVHLIENYDASKRGLNDKENDNFQVDHKLSIYDGFMNGIAAEVIGHFCNLEFMSWRENSKKWHKSSMTLEKLLEEIQKSEKGSN